MSKRPFTALLLPLYPSTAADLRPPEEFQTMAKVMPEQIEATKGGEHELRPAEVSAAAPLAAPGAGPQAPETGELDDAALDHVSGGIGIIKLALGKPPGH